MKGHVPTPGTLADKMVTKLFEALPPKEGDRILYPGCGTGPFITAVDSYCVENNRPTPNGVGVELDPKHLAEARDRHADGNVKFLQRDFLTDVSELGEFKYIVGNPPYVPIEGLEDDEKERHKARFETAEGRFDLYVLFFEQALDILKENGRLVFITPEKFEYTETTAQLRKLLSSHHVEEIEHVDEDSFGDLVTYPTITTVRKQKPGPTSIILRGTGEHSVDLPDDGSSWAPTIRGGEPELGTGVTLNDISKRISCGVATGADDIFVIDEDEVPPQLEPWTYPTTSGKQLRINDGPESGQVFISPYREDGRLVPENRLDSYADWAELHRNQLESRSCVENGSRPWYAWHENPPLDDILQPKLLCKDITEEPHFWRDSSGDVVPRHSVYYLIPEDNVELDELQTYLNSRVVGEWLEANCQRASNGFLRLQSSVLKDLPVPEEFGQTRQAKLQNVGQ